MAEEMKLNYAGKHCNKCSMDITYKNWSRHLKSKTHQTNDPTNEEIKEQKKEKVTCQELKQKAKYYNLRGFSKWTKSQLISAIDQAKDVLHTREDLEKLKVPQLREIGLNNNIRATTRMKKAEIIESILKTQDLIFRNKVAQELSFHDDLIVPSREERKPPYKITETNSRLIKKFNTTEVDYTIHIEKIMEVENAINAMIKLAKQKGNYTPGDKLTIIVSNPHFNHDISTVVQSDAKARSFMNHVGRILSSNENLSITQTKFNIKIINMPKGQGRSKIINLSQDVHTKKCITQIRNKDNLCCPRAIITALTYNTNKILDRELSELNIKHIRQGRKIQTELTQELCKRVGNYNEEGFTLEDIKNVEKILNIQVKIVCAENFNSVIYAGDDKDTKVYLYKSGNHFDVINSMKAFLGSSYYCNACDKPYNNKDKHKCAKNAGVCLLCKKPSHSIEDKNKIYCKECNRYCYNQACLDHHNKVCKEVYKCNGCNMILLRTKEHKCGYSFCYNCMETDKTGEHQCYIQTKRQKGGKCDLLCVCNTNDRNSFLETFLRETRGKLSKHPKIKSLRRIFNEGYITVEEYNVLFSNTLWT